MIVSTLIAATLAAQPAPTPQPSATPATAAEKKIACCEKTAKGDGCSCCKGMGKEHHDEQGTKGGEGTGGQSR